MDFDDRGCAPARPHRRPSPYDAVPCVPCAMTRCALVSPYAPVPIRCRTLRVLYHDAQSLSARAESAVAAVAAAMMATSGAGVAGAAGVEGVVGVAGPAAAVVGAAAAARFTLSFSFFDSLPLFLFIFLGQHVTLSDYGYAPQAQLCREKRRTQRDAPHPPTHTRSHTDSSRACLPSPRSPFASPFIGNNRAVRRPASCHIHQRCGRPVLPILPCAIWPAAGVANFFCVCSRGGAYVRAKFLRELGGGAAPDGSIAGR